MNAVQQEKVKLRNNLLQQRQAMAVQDWQERSDRICAHLQSSLLFQSSQTILAYFSFRQEPDLTSLFILPPYRWGFPRCVEQSLSWHSWQPGEAQEKGRFGIYEPSPHTPSLSPQEVDLILVPAVACDGRGYRLGYGGGFYDRMLAQKEWQSIPTIGIIFDFALIPRVPIEPWDTRLHGVCTETGLILHR